MSVNFLYLIQKAVTRTTEVESSRLVDLYYMSQSFEGRIAA